MEIRFDPRLTSLPKVQKKKDRRGRENAFEEVLQGEEGEGSGRSAETEVASTAGIGPKKGQKPRNGDGKGLKVDLLA